MFNADLMQFKDEMLKNLREIEKKNNGKSQQKSIRYIYRYKFNK